MICLIFGQINWIICSVGSDRDDNYSQSVYYKGRVA